MVEPQIFTFLQADRLAGRSSDDEKGYLLDLQGWVGTDTSKFWGKVEGDGVGDGPLEMLEVQALYSRMIGPFFDLQVGLRQDVTPDVSRTHAVVGVQGLAPYWFEMDGAFFVGDTGDMTARLEAEYELLFSQRVILQPRTELNVAFQEIEGLGSPGFLVPALVIPSPCGKFEFYAALFFSLFGREAISREQPGDSHHGGSCPKHQRARRGPATVGSIQERKRPG